MGKITRGLAEDPEDSKEFAEAFKKCELHKLYQEHRNELFLGVRNNYLNLYYNCDSIAKVKYTKRSICCKIDKYYLDGTHYKSIDKKIQEIAPSKINEKYEIIKMYSDKKGTEEKIAQSKLVLLNNNNKESNWFCIDVEYVKAFRNKDEKDKANLNCRFDVIALSKEKPHRVALIELKHGSGAIGGKSGIYKHVEDFTKFCKKKYFEDHLKGEIIDIIKSQKLLGIDVPFELSSAEDLLSPPEFYFITLNNNPDPENENASTPKQTMAGYLFKDKRWDCKRLTKQNSVEEMFGDITNKKNEFHATFLFSKATFDNIEITDIIDGKYDERIIPAG